MEMLRRMWVLLLATGIVWVCVAATVAIDLGEFVNGAAAILALIATITIWSMWALDAYGIDVDGTSERPVREKPKRDADTQEDARLALMLALLTPEERETIRARLAEDMANEGEVVSLGDLLAEQERSHQHMQHG